MIDTEMIQGLQIVVDMLSGLGFYSLFVLIVGILSYAIVYICGFYFIPKFLVDMIKAYFSGKENIAYTTSLSESIAKNGTIIDVNKHLITTDATPQLVYNMLDSIKDGSYIHEIDIKNTIAAIEVYKKIRNKLHKSKYEINEPQKILEELEAKVKK